MLKETTISTAKYVYGTSISLLFTELAYSFSDSNSFETGNTPHQQRSAVQYCAQQLQLCTCISGYDPLETHDVLAKVSCEFDSPYHAYFS